MPSDAPLPDLELIGELSDGAIEALAALLIEVEEAEPPEERS